jgi:type I restriction enzyme S subunit
MTEHPLKLPRGWSMVTLPDLIGVRGLLTDGDWIETEDQDPNGEVRLTQLADIGDGQFRDRSNRFLTTGKASKLGCTFLEKGDVMVARMPDPLGRACLFPGSVRPAVTAVDVCVIRPGDAGVSTRWLMHAINTPAFRRAVAQLQSGSTRKRISKKNLCTIFFPVPPSSEQHRIADAIDTHFSRLDEAGALLERIQRNLTRYRAAVLNTAVHGSLVPTEAALARREGRDYEPASGLLERILAERRRRWEETELAKMKAAGKAPKDDRWKAKYTEPLAPDTEGLPELPEGWCWASLPQLALPDRHAIKAGPFGSALKKEFYALSGFKIYGQEQVIRGDHSYGDYFIDGQRYQALRSCAVRPGDVLISLVGTIGRLLVLPDDAQPGIINPRLIKVSFDHRLIDPHFFRVFFASPSAQGQLLRESQGATMNVLNLGILMRLSVPLPPRGEQSRLAAEVDRHDSIASEQAVEVERVHARCSRLRQSILKWAFDGKLLDQESTDEPASALLERIKGERGSREETASRARRPAPRRRATA